MVNLGYIVFRKTGIISAVTFAQVVPRTELASREVYILASKSRLYEASIGRPARIAT